MNNEFGYIYNKPFKEIDDNIQKLAIINKEEKNIEIKVKDEELFNFFNTSLELEKFLNPKVIYGVNKLLNPITLYRPHIKSSSFGAISYSIITSNMYIIGNSYEMPLTHFTDKTKVKKIIYFNDNIRHIFPNKAMTIKRKEGEISINAKRQKDETIVNTKYKDNQIEIKLINDFYHTKSLENLRIKTISYFEINFKKNVNLDFVITIKNRIDSIIHLLLLTKGRSKELTLYDSKENTYKLYDLKNDDIEKVEPLYTLNKKNSKEDFNKLFKTFINIENKNAFFPFLNYDQISTSIQIKFLEYFKTLEFIDTEKRKKNNKGKNKLFILDLIKKYPKAKTKFFNSQNHQRLEEQIRALRNYYSHEGYYITKLPVPTEKPKYYKTVTKDWIQKAEKYIRTLAYLEIYSLANIQIDEENLLNHLYF